MIYVHGIMISDHIHTIFSQSHVVFGRKILVIHQIVFHKHTQHAFVIGHNPWGPHPKVQVLTTSYFVCCHGHYRWSFANNNNKASWRFFLYKKKRSRNTGLGGFNIAWRKRFGIGLRQEAHKIWIQIVQHSYCKGIHTLVLLNTTIISYDKRGSSFRPKHAWYIYIYI